MEILAWVIANYIQVLAAVSGLCLVLIPFFMLIPGEQPEKFLQKVVDLVAKFSKK